LVGTARCAVRAALSGATDCAKPVGKSFRPLDADGDPATRDGVSPFDSTAKTVFYLTPARVQFIFARQSSGSDEPRRGFYLQCRVASLPIKQPRSKQPGFPFYPRPSTAFIAERRLAAGFPPGFSPTANQCRKTDYNSARHAARLSVDFAAPFLSILRQIKICGTRLAAKCRRQHARGVHSPSN